MALVTRSTRTRFGVAILLASASACTSWLGAEALIEKDDEVSHAGPDALTVDGPGDDASQEAGTADSGADAPLLDVIAPRYCETRDAANGFCEDFDKPGTKWDLWEEAPSGRGLALDNRAHSPPFAIRAFIQTDAAPPRAQISRSFGDAEAFRRLLGEIAIRVSPDAGNVALYRLTVQRAPEGYAYASLGTANGKVRLDIRAHHADGGYVDGLPPEDFDNDGGFHVYAIELVAGDAGSAGRLVYRVDGAIVRDTALPGAFGDRLPLQAVVGVSSTVPAEVEALFDDIVTDVVE